MSFSENPLFEKFYNWSLKYLEVRPRSEKEIRDYLKLKIDRNVKKGWLKVEPAETFDLIQQIIERLTSVGLLNDEEFAKSWVASRGQKRSVRVLQSELYKKGISREISEEVLGKFEEDEGGQLELIRKQARKAWPKYSKLPEKEVKQKLYGFLLRRGFDWEDIKAVVDEIAGKA